MIERAGEYYTGFSARATDAATGGRCPATCAFAAALPGRLFGHIFRRFVRAPGLGQGASAAHGQVAEPLADQVHGGVQGVGAGVPATRRRGGGEQVHLVGGVQVVHADA